MQLTAGSKAAKIIEKERKSSQDLSISLMSKGRPKLKANAPQFVKDKEVDSDTRNLL